MLFLVGKLDERDFRMGILAIGCHVKWMKGSKKMERKKKKDLQAHLSQLVLQSQKQVWQWAQWLMLLFNLSVMLTRTRGRCRKGFLKVFPGSMSGSVQSTDPLTQLGLVMLHHVKYALHVGMDWVAWACWLDKAQNSKSYCKPDNNRMTSGSLSERILPFLWWRVFFGALAQLRNAFLTLVSEVRDR